MQERERFAVATAAAEMMYHLWEMAYRRGDLDLDAMMRRLKDLSAYSLTHAEVLEQREGVEMLALAMLFGATTDPAYHPNQERLSLLSEETVAYAGRAAAVEQEVALRRRPSSASRPREGDEEGPRQPRLL